MFTLHNLQSIFPVFETAEQAITRGSTFIGKKKSTVRVSETAYYAK